MRQASYEDSDGRKWAVWLPEDVPDSDASLGLPMGPPSLEGLGLPLELEVRLHNNLVAAGLLTWADVKRNRTGVVSAIRATLSPTTEQVLTLYYEAGLESSSALADNQKDSRSDSRS